jgi:hypothetical protein
MSDEKSEAISRRIRALLNLTTENGASEAEALAAASKAQELMQAHRLTMSDVEITNEPVDQIEVERTSTVRYAPADYTARGIEALCGVRSWMSRRNVIRDGYYRSHTVRKFLGLRPDVEMARYLYTMIGAAISVELSRYQASRGFKSRTETSSFQVGMARRINNRLLDMAEAAAPVAKTATGTSLVVVKNAVVEAAYASLGLKFSGSYTGMSASSGSAYSAGKAAGDRVNLSRPLASGNTKHLR